jgi:hypothetical protein
MNLGMTSIADRVRILFLGLAVVVAACIEPYALEGVESDPDFLVVDGFIDATNLAATVKLSRAIGLDDDSFYPAIRNARVAIESESGNEILLQQVDLTQNPGYDTGTYLAYDIPINMAERYRLKIELNNGAGKQYLSDYITIEKAAPIESVEWDTAGDDVRILVNTVETNENSRFYRWRYDETWEYNAPFYSAYYMDAEREMIFRPNNEQIYICYREVPSFEILIGSSQNLNSNVIRNYPLKLVPRNSIKLSRTYSINIKQYGLTEDAYTYWLNLYKTTESTGGLFDPMPGQIFGNIKSVTDPTEMVIGYFSASTVEEKRIFINRAELPPEFFNYRHPFCEIDTILNENLSFVAPGSTFYYAIYDLTGREIIGYSISSLSCLDCRRFGGGATTKPDYWP